MLGNGMHTLSTRGCQGDPRSSNTSVENMGCSVNFRLAGFAAIAASVVASAASAGTLTNTSVTLSSSSVSSPSTVTTAYTIETAMGGGNSNILIATYPGLAFVNGTCTNGEVTVSVGGTPIVGAFQICVLFSGNSIQISLPAGVTVPAGSNVSVFIPNTRVSTGPTAGTYSANIRTAQSTGATVDAPAPAPTYTFSVAPTPVPTMTEWAMILFGTILAGGAALYIQRRKLIA